MRSDQKSEFLPRSGCARVFMAVLAIPSFLILFGCLIAFPTCWIPWPPKSVGEAIGLFSICEVLAAACLFMILALIWAVAAPAWLESWLESGARRLVAMTGMFLVTTSVGLAVAMISSGLVIVFIVSAASLILGLHLLRVASRPDWPVPPREHEIEQS